MKQPKTKEFQLNETEILKLRVSALEFEKALTLYQNNMALITEEFCKRVGQKRENIVLDPNGKVIISPEGFITFKEA